MALQDQPLITEFRISEKGSRNADHPHLTSNIAFRLASLLQRKEQPQVTRAEELKEVKGARRSAAKSLALQLASQLATEIQGALSSQSERLAMHIDTSARTLSSGGIPKVRVAAAAPGFLNFYLPFELHAPSERRLSLPKAPKSFRYALDMDWVRPDGGPEFFDLFVRYQLHVHREPLERVTLRQFTSFLADTPVVSSPNNPFGSWFCCYRLVECAPDDEAPNGNGAPTVSSAKGRLVGFTAMDILAEGLHSNYFVWEPDVKALRLGVLSALDEIKWVRHAPEFQIFNARWFYLAYFVPENDKMRYKLQYGPSQLFCPMSRDWIDMDPAKAVLRIDKRAPLIAPPELVSRFRAAAPGEQKGGDPKTTAPTTPLNDAIQAALTVANYTGITHVYPFVQPVV
jgi:arginyl-tRNA--protein-N-Asp/Glu arginylyltransferase